MAPTGEVQIVAVQAASATITPTPTQATQTQAGDAASSITAISECHLHGSALYVSPLLCLLIV
jgi:zinc transporter 1/2/3